MMSNDAKFFLCLCGFVTTIVVSIAANMAFSTYNHTVRFKECISAGYEWARDANYAEMACKKVQK